MTGQIFLQNIAIEIPTMKLLQINHFYLSCEINIRLWKDIGPIVFYINI